MSPNNRYMMIPKNKLLLIIKSCNSELCINLEKQSKSSWIPMIDKKYHIVFVKGDISLKENYSIETFDRYSILTLKTEDDFDSLSKKTKKLYTFLKKNTNISFYWFLDHDTYVNPETFNQFKDYGYDWYGSGPWSTGKQNFIIGCGYYISRKLLEIASNELKDNGHFDDISLGKVFDSNKNLRIKYSSIIHHNEKGLPFQKIDNLLFGHKVYDMVQFHSLYK